MGCRFEPYFWSHFCFLPSSLSSLNIFPYSLPLALDVRISRKRAHRIFPVYFFTEGFKMSLLLELVLLENYYEKIIPLIERGDDDRASERSIGANRNGSG